MLFAVATGLAAAVLFGLTPALQVARQRHRATLMRQILIGAQVAASCVLLIVAGLLARALNHAASTNGGFDYGNVVSIDPALGAHGYSPAQAASYLDSLQTRLLNVPGVESVSLASSAPFGNKTVTVGAEFGGRPVKIHVNNIDPQFFQTMRIPLLRGRNLARGDTRAIVVSQSLAARAWPAEDPLGKPFPLGTSEYAVIGVAGNARVTSPEDGDAVEGYFLAGLTDLPSVVVLVRTSGPPEGLAPTLVSIAKGVDPKVPPQVELMKRAFGRKLESAQYSALSVGVLAMVALFLACLGIVGLVAYSVSQRTKEIGIRMALGAEPAHVVRSVLRQFSRPVVAGLVVGVGAAAALSQVLRQVLYGISSLDPIAYLTAIGLFLAMAALAAVLPARRALRVDPLRALRCD